MTYSYLRTSIFFSETGSYSDSCPITCAYTHSSCAGWTITPSANVCTFDISAPDGTTDSCSVTMTMTNSVMSNTVSSTIEFKP